ncbi:MAG: metallophosphoesterase [Muribaculaceae bacterium]|nr:metallophosphoesterase [Muribaculaceae bacterium]
MKRIAVACFMVIVFQLSTLAARKSFILLGDIHYDKIENHDLEWLMEREGDFRQVTEGYCVNTEKYWNKFSSAVKAFSDQDHVKCIVQLGDLSEGLAGTETLAYQMANGLFQAIDDVGFNVPFIICRGNHDTTGPGAKEAFNDVYLPNMQRLSGTSDNVTSSRYATTIDDMLFVSYDSYDNTCTPAWLDQVLKASDARYKFVLNHEPVIPITYRVWHAYRTAAKAATREQFLKVIAQNRAIALTGHLHVYSVVRRDTEWGPILQLAANSVINNDSFNSVRNLVTEYTTAFVDAKPNYVPEEIENRRALIAAEAPYVRYFREGDICGYGVITIDDETGEIIYEYYADYKTEPCETVNLTEIMALEADIINVVPSSADFGHAYKGQQITRNFQLKAFGLSPEQGTITVTAPVGFEVSDDNINFTNTISVDYTGGAISQEFFLRCNFSDDGDFNSIATVSNGIKSTEIELKGTARPLETGLPTTVYYRLGQDALFSVDGAAGGLKQTVSGLTVSGYNYAKKDGTIWPDWTGYNNSDKNRFMQRITYGSGTWPENEPDIISDRYIEFGAKANPGLAFKISDISLFLCAIGGTNMRCKVYYSTEDDFSNPVMIADYSKKMIANTVYHAEGMPDVTITGDQTLRVRIYPFYGGTPSSGKSLCISDVTIKGTAIDLSGADSVVSVPTPVNVCYYNIDGTRSTGRRRGLNIVRTTYSDGSVKTSKIYY